jgi:metal transporter CNNM
MDALIWTGIAICISQSAIFSGLNLAVFGVGRLRLEIEASSGNRRAVKLLKLRQDPNFLLTTILWGNVGINVLLTLLSGSVLAGVAAFLFSTVVITFIGEIFPQAYFSRNALRMASALYPVLRFYQFILFPIAKPVALVLDAWLGKEGISYFKEKDLREMIKQHIKAQESDIDRLEGIGSLNFLQIDDMFAGLEGEDVNPDSLVELDMKKGRPVLPDFGRDVTDPFLKKLHSSKEKWVIITDHDGRPRFAMDADGFVLGALFDGDSFRPFQFIHRPIIVDPTQTLGEAILQLEVHPEHPADDVIDEDLILVWSDERRKVITGSDILGRLLRGIAKVVKE